MIIVAAGRGARMGAAVPKQLLDLGGRSILQRSVDAFDAHPLVAELVVVLPPDLVAAGASFVAAARPMRFVAGGERRQDSVRLGLAALPATVDLVLVHDAARPFVDIALIDRVIAGAGEAGAAVPGVAAEFGQKGLLEYFGRPEQAFMVNFRVADLDAMLAQLRSAGVEVIDALEESEYGRFGWAVDPEGTRFEIWEPPPGS